MTVKELKEQLAKYSDDTEVWYFNEDDTLWHPADNVIKVLENELPGTVNITIFGEDYKRAIAPLGR